MAEKVGGVSIGVKAFVTSAIILLAMMVAAGILTLVLPSGSYERIKSDGGEVLVPGSYHETPKPDYPAWRWFTAPAEVLVSPDAVMAIIIILFITIAGGSFSVLNEGRVLASAVAALAKRFGKRRFLLLGIICLFCMLLGAIMGVFEESVLLVPVGIALAASFGWDVFMVLGMSVLATGFGFAAAISNPFSIGTAQKIAGLPLFSGAPFRVLVFAACYALYMAFLVAYARSIEGKGTPAATKIAGGKVAMENPAIDPRLEARGVRVFSWSMLALLLIILFVAFTPGLSDLSMPLMALAFLAAGLVTGFAAGLSGKRVGKAFLDGALGVLPAALLILMALSVKRIILAGGILDTVLFHAATAATGASAYGSAAIAYILTLGLEFFVGSASAKAFLLMPILAPLGDLAGVTRQVMVQAYAFGDGFSNMLYPTNAVLIISLSLAGVSWLRWARWVLPLQLATFALTMGLLMLAVAIGYR
ncbi:MAG: hypothetical protein ACOYM2_09910 [Rectinemataceae bacterium]